MLGKILVRPVTTYLGQNDLFFSIDALREKLSHFDLKSWVKFLLRQRLNF